MTDRYCWYERNIVSNGYGFAHSQGRIKRTRTGAWKLEGKRYRTYRLAFAAMFRSVGGIAIG